MHRHRHIERLTSDESICVITSLQLISKGIRFRSGLLACDLSLERYWKTCGEVTTVSLHRSNLLEDFASPNYPKARSPSKINYIL